MSTVNPGDAGMAMLRLEQQEMLQKRLDMDSLRERLNGRPDKKAKLREACEGFETVFIQKLWEQMRKNVQQSGYLHSRDEHMYQAMYDGEFSKKMAQAGGIGLADMLYDQLSQRLGESSRTTSTQHSPRLPIIPAASSVSAINSAVLPLGGSAGQGGIPLHNSNIRPLYEDAPVLAAPVPAAAEPELTSEPALTSYDEELDLEELSQSLLSEELAAPEEATFEPRAAPEASDFSLSLADEALFAAALRQNMADAGRITAQQAPMSVLEPSARFGTTFAQDTTSPADSAALSVTNNLPRS